MSDKARSFGTWEKTDCDECGCEFQVTRTSPKEIKGDVICSDCETYKRGYSEGNAELAAVTQELEQAKAELNSKQAIICQQGEWLEVLESKLEQLKQSSVVMPEDKTNEQQFLIELAILQKKYGVAICSELSESGKYSHVFYAPVYTSSFKKVMTSREHACPYETLLYAGLTCSEANNFSYPQALATNDKEKDSE